MNYVIIFFILFSSLSFSFENVYVRRSAKGTLMGDAFTSYANDEFTLFYNPALLARNKGFKFYPLNININTLDILKELDEADKYEDLSDDPNELFSEFQGKDLHIDAGYTATIKMGNLGLTAFFAESATLGLTNSISPTVEVNYKLDSGFIVGYAQPLGGNLRANSGSQYALGASLKYIKREGIQTDFLLFSPTFVAAISNGDVKDTLDALGKASGGGWGVDLGFDYIKRTSSMEYAFSLALKDIVSGVRTKSESIYGTGIQEQNFQANIGTHIRFDFSDVIELAFSMDIRSLQDTTQSFASKMRIGAELGTPILSVYAGNNSGYFSYGIFTNLGIARIYLGLYGAELGQDYKLEKSDRMLIYLSLFNIKFDA